jgi:endonuclease/exonuclease/phosphatase family metal-dependent hydrolase
MLNLLRYILSSVFLFVYNSIQLLIKSPRSYFSEHTKPSGKEARELSLDLRKNYSSVLVLTHNIHKGRDLFYNYTLNELINTYIKECPDILNLQDIYDYEQFKYIKKALGFKYGYYADHKAILTDYNIEESSVHYYKQKGIYRDNSYLLVKLSIGNKYLYVVNVHLSCDITGYKQERELREINEYLETNMIKYDLVISGDFNCSSLFPALEIMNNYTQVNPKKTYPSVYPMFSFTRIFYTSQHVSLKNNRVLKNKKSDSLALATDLCFNNDKIQNNPVE